MADSRLITGNAVALLEILVHSNLGRVPKGFAYIEIDVPTGVGVEEITANDLPGWADADCESSQAFGNQWYQEKRSAVLIVPSAAAGRREAALADGRIACRFQARDLNLVMGPAAPGTPTTLPGAPRRAAAGPRSRNRRG